MLFDHGANLVSGARVVDEEAVLRTVGQGATFQQVEGVRLLTIERRHDEMTKHKRTSVKPPGAASDDTGPEGAGKDRDEQTPGLRPCDGRRLRRRVPARSSPDTTQKKEVLVTARPGQKAPEFTAPSYHRGGFTPVKLADFAGKWVLLCFYPGDFTFV